MTTLKTTITWKNINQSNRSQEPQVRNVEVLLFMSRTILNTKLLNFKVQLNAWSYKQTLIQKQSKTFALYTDHTATKSLGFCKSSKNYSSFYGDWKMTLFCAVTSTLTELKNQRTNLIMRNCWLWEKILALDFKRQNFEPTRVTPTSATCLDHIVTSYQINTETIKTTISDHYTVLGAIPGVIVKESKNRVMKQLSRDLRKIKGGNALNFCSSYIKHSKNSNHQIKKTLKR